jgi:hypothetical protein
MLPGFFIGVRQGAFKRKPVIPECEYEETRSSLGTITAGKRAAYRMKLWRKRRSINGSVSKHIILMEESNGVLRYPHWMAKPNRL